MTQANDHGQGWCVITTIQAPTACVAALAGTLHAQGMTLLAAGDRKGPERFDIPGARFFPLDEQKASGFALAALLPENHYTRKNLGYLEAIRSGAAFLYETDDDNRPAPGWAPRTLDARALACRGQGWVNVYAHFGGGHVWPRGLPLEAARLAPEPDGRPLAGVSPVQQGLADGSPDVDAIWRMLYGQDTAFDQKPSLRLAPGLWCPFNSQNTWWWPEAYPLLYLPSHCGFRMTDIWRSFVAQRCLWAMGRELVFHGADVVQERNLHDLRKDFADEVAGHMHNGRIAAVLQALDLPGGADQAGGNLRRCYEALASEGIIPGAELPLVDAWLADLDALAVSHTTTTTRE